MLAFLYNIFQWVVISIVIPALVLGFLGGAVFFILRGLGALGPRRKKSFDEWNRNPKQYERKENNNGT